MHGDPSGLELRGRLGYISVKGQTVLYWTKWMMIVWIPVPIAVIQCTSKDVGGGGPKASNKRSGLALGYILCCI